ncbi:MAG TPA: hypothetical protein DCY35_05395 [Prolixibacteraceae bacterium]|nr:hypothetical protein [Prolixibacteraceae bacterium]
MELNLKKTWFQLIPTESKGDQGKIKLLAQLYQSQDCSVLQILNQRHHLGDKPNGSSLVLVFFYFCTIKIRISQLCDDQDWFDMVLFDSILG